MRTTPVNTPGVPQVTAMICLLIAEANCHAAGHLWLIDMSHGHVTMQWQMLQLQLSNNKSWLSIDNSQ